LVDKDVLKGSDKNAEPYIFTPRHAGKDGEPVTLVENNGQPLWYCSRFVRDEYIRQRRGQSTRFDEDNQPPKAKPKQSPKPPIGDDLGDGSTSSSTSSNELSNSESNCNLAEENKTPTPTQKLVGEVMQALREIKFMPFNPDLPEFIALIQAGATPEEFANTAMEFKGTDKFKPSYLLSTMIGRRQDAAKLKLHKGPMPAATNREAGRQVAAASVFTAENTQHLQGNTLKIVEVEHDQRAIAN
jgi:hypothetical protein